MLSEIFDCTNLNSAAGGMIGCAVSLLLEIIMLALYQHTNNRGGNSAAVFFLFLHIGL